jgi:hypothetical protein
MVRFLRNLRAYMHGMKLSTGYIFVIFLVALTFADCKKNIGISNRQAILFEYQHINYALNYQHYGFIIDNEGKVLAYKNPEAWNFPDRELRISDSQVADNLALCTATGVTIPKADLEKYSAYIKNLASSKVSALKNVAEDAGSSQYICYQYSESTGMYKGTIIKMEGDFTCENLNFFSRKVTDWMKNIISGIPLN